MAFELFSPSDQVARHLRDEILKGRWRREVSGTPALSEELGVDRKTVTAALNLLQKEGLLASQGPGKPRLVAKSANPKTTRLTIRFMPYDGDDHQLAHCMGLISRIKAMGHHIEMDSLTLKGSHMNLQKIKKHVHKHPADAWILHAASREILEWFKEKDIPVIAVFGRRRQVQVASIGPDKVSAMRACVRRLCELGHRRIVLMAREERRRPVPGYIELEFLEELKKNGIEPGPYHLPDWNDNPKGFHQCLDKLFRHTPPTALILVETHFYVAAMQHLIQKGLCVPQDVSLACSESHPVFNWCQPSVSHIHWEADPIIKHVVKWVRKLSRGINDKECCYTPAVFLEGGSIGPVNSQANSMAISI